MKFKIAFAALLLTVAAAWGTVSKVSTISWSGLSTDTKPSSTTGAAVSHTFFETDTGRTFRYDGTTWNLVRKFKASSQGNIAAAGAKPGIAAAGFTNAAVVYGGGGTAIGINFVMEGYVSNIPTWFKLSATNTVVSTALNDSAAVIIITNIAYLDSIRIKATAVTTSDTLYYKISLFEE